MKLIKDLGMQFTSATMKYKKRYGLYKCPKCHATVRTQTSKVKHGRSTQCKRCINITHGLRSNPLYGVWYNMVHRCYNPTDKNYHRYGMLGVTVDTTWQKSFKDFLLWATNNGWEKGLHLDKDIKCRQQNISPMRYGPDTCMFIPPNENIAASVPLAVHNTSGYRGVSKQHGKWVARISVEDNQIYLGRFTCKEEAATAYNNYVIENNLSHTINVIQV